MYRAVLLVCVLFTIVACQPAPEEPAPFVPLEPKIAEVDDITCTSNEDCGGTFCSGDEQITAYCSFEGQSNQGVCREITTPCTQGCTDGICKGDECRIIPGQPVEGCEAQHCSDNAVIAPYCDVSDGRVQIVDGVRVQIGYCAQKEVQFCPGQEICTQGFCKGLPCGSDVDCGADYCDRGTLIRPFCQFRDPATGILMQQGFCSHSVPLECPQGKTCRNGACY